MKLLNWADVHLVVKTIVELKVDFSNMNEDDAYEIEKITDTIFGEVRKKELEKSR